MLGERRRTYRCMRNLGEGDREPYYSHNGNIIEFPHMKERAYRGQVINDVLSSHNQTEEQNRLYRKFQYAENYIQNDEGRNVSYTAAAVRRNDPCVRYSEDGYPAGTWRMPNHRELMLMLTAGLFDSLSDGAHALGSSYKGEMIGNIADFTVFSFHAVKNFTTAEGGSVTWKDHAGIDNDDLYHQFQILSLHGQTKDALEKTKLGSWEYDIVIPGYKCNMTDVMASIGLVQYKRYPDLLRRRREIVSRYNAEFEGTTVSPLQHVSDSYESSMHLYIVHIDGIKKEQRNAIIEKMAEAGIACNVHYKPLPLLTAYANMGFKIEDYPNAQNYFENTMTLPLHTKLSDEEVDYVIETLKGILADIR